MIEEYIHLKNANKHEQILEYWIKTSTITAVATTKNKNHTVIICGAQRYLVDEKIDVVLALIT